MDWSLLDLSKDAEDVASGLQIFVDDVPGYDRDFLAHISALFAISAELRRLDELISRRANRRAAAKVTYELDLLCASMEMTLDTVKADLFGARAQASPRRADGMIEDLDEVASIVKSLKARQLTLDTDKYGE
ncbi:hypothetical protein SLS57_006287 [Botryosphaeria dothidea]